MLKVVCTFLALFIVLAVLCSNKVESRMIHGKLEGVPSSQLHYVRIGTGQVNSESSNEDNHEEKIHTKRKSELMSSLYALPYALVNKRDAN